MTSTRWRATPPPPIGATRLRVVVAEDDDDLRALVTLALRSAGYLSVPVRNGAELLDYLSDALLSGDASRGPDLVISDVRMPGVTGLAVLTGLRDERWSRPFILMTAYADDNLRAEARRLGATLFSKPFEIDDLLTVALNLLPVDELAIAHTKRPAGST